MINETERFCPRTGKLIYRSRADATAERTKICRRREQTVKTMRAYRCQFCGGFHLASESKQLRQLRSRRRDGET